ncbi:hypothetical protein C0Q70_01859 [Pomacea canaliculata]|uniref:Formin GTPase-binding domain-containing protein n=1 Tax=Pomacea canaliculata TaxID=400727 RepID=A0A2T7Q0N4_POMCA|nr:hypothetical protein C0Q70_01859 [Pomacea canaliculata]
MDDKWKIVFKEHARAPIYSVSHYVTYLRRFVWDTADSSTCQRHGSRSSPDDKSRPRPEDGINPLSYFLRKLMLDLKVSYDSFVSDFVRPPNDGLGLLLRLLGNLQNSGTPGRSRPSSGRSMSKLEDYKRIMTDERDCLLCIKFTLRLKNAVSQLVEDVEGLQRIAAGVTGPNSKARITCLEILTLVLMECHAADKVVEAFTIMRLRLGESVRFKMLVSMLHTKGPSQVLFQCAQGDGLEFDDLKREIQEWNRRYIDVRLDFSSPPTSDTHPLTCRRVDSLLTRLKNHNPSHNIDGHQNDFDDSGSEIVSVSAQQTPTRSRKHPPKIRLSSSDPHLTTPYAASTRTPDANEGRELAADADDDVTKGTGDGYDSGVYLHYDDRTQAKNNKADRRDWEEQCYPPTHCIKSDSARARREGTDPIVDLLHAPASHLLVQNNSRKTEPSCLPTPVPDYTPSASLAGSVRSLNTEVARVLQDFERTLRAHDQSHPASTRPSYCCHRNSSTQHEEMAAIGEKQTESLTP